MKVTGSRDALLFAGLKCYRVAGGALKCDGKGRPLSRRLFLSSVLRFAVRMKKACLDLGVTFVADVLFDLE